MRRAGCGGHGAVREVQEPFSLATLGASLRGVLTLANGVPSHDTFSRLFRQLDPEAFRAAFGRFMAGFSGQCRSLAPVATPDAGATDALAAGVVAIDGKVLRRSFDRASGKSALHMVSAWGCEQRLVLAQVTTDAKSNEITAVPALLRLLSLQGTVVTADALHCQRATARQTVDQGGDYALALKGNQGTLHDGVVRVLDDPASKADTAKPMVDAGHGRIETRTATVSADIGWLQEQHEWPGFAAIGKVRRIRETATGTTAETAYDLLSTALLPDRLNEVARSHRGIETQPH